MLSKPEIHACRVIESAYCEKLRGMIELRGMGWEQGTAYYKIYPFITRGAAGKAWEVYHKNEGYVL